MADDPILTAAGHIADGDVVDWSTVTSSLNTDHDRELADELAIVQQIARGHRQLHQLLPVGTDTAPHLDPDQARWGHLDLLNIVGRGSYGTVYRAWDTRLERLVALKLFHGAADPDAVMQEGRMLARIRHENVVTVYGADVINGTAGIWMELVHGETLDHLVKKNGPLAPREAAAIGADIARALGAIHEAGLLHCDVKAQNVVRETSGRVVLMDLGAGRLAPEARESDSLSDIKGTPRYMAPELFINGAMSTRASDTYSLGVLLFYLASGQFPVEGRTLGELKRAHQLGERRSLSTASSVATPRYAALVMRLLDPDASLRPPVSELLPQLARLASPRAPIGTVALRWLMVAAVIAAVAIISFRIARGPDRAGAAAVHAIAVLPIANLTGDSSKEYVAQGLTEVLISNLARVRSLRVPSFAAVAKHRDGRSNPAAAAKALGVNLLLAGSVMQVGPRVRLAVQLIDPRSGDAIWGEELARDPAGLISAQAEIGRMVASRLALQLSAEETHALADRTIDARAQDLYLQGIAWSVAAPVDNARASASFRAAVEIDPNFADAWAQLSLIELRLIEGTSGLDRQNRASFARQVAQRALDLDPNLASGFAALGSVQFYHDWDFDHAEQTLRRSIAVNPSYAFARQRLAMLLAARTRLDEAITLGRESQALEPEVPIHTGSLGMLYYYARDYPHAIEETRRSASIAPNFALADFALGRIFSAQGKHEQAIASLEKSVAADPNSGWIVELARAYAAAGRRDDTARVLADLSDRERAGESYSRDNLAYIAAAEGRADDAIRILSEAIERRLTNVLWIAVDPRVDPLRRDPRFAALLDRMKIARR